MKRRFSTLELIKQSLRDAGSRYVLMAALIFVTLVSGASSFLLPVSEVAAIERDRTAADLRGASTFSVIARDRSTFDGRACEALRSTSGIKAAGGRGEVRPSSGPLFESPTQSVVNVTPGFPEVVWPELNEARDGARALYLGQDLAQEINAVPGTSISLELDGTADTIGGVATGPARIQAFDTTVSTLVAPDTLVIECLVEASPGAQEAVGTLLNDRFSKEMLVRTIYTADAAASTPEERLASRTSAVTPFAGGAAVIVIGALAVLIRRTDIALYRLYGMTGRQTAAILFVEYLLTIVPAAFGGLGLGLAVSSTQLPTRFATQVALMDWASFAVMTVALVPIALTVALSKRPIALIRES